MHDIKQIRTNPEAFKQGMLRRGYSDKEVEGMVNSILEADEAKRKLQTQKQELESKRNQLNKSIGMARGKGEDATALMAEAKQVNVDLEALGTAIASDIEQLAALPNISADDVPLGKDEHANKQVRIHGEKPNFAFMPKMHDDLGAALGLLDFEGAAKISGARFVVLKGALARMERALASFFLDNNVEAGYTEMVPPYLVRDNAAYGTGQLPKFSEDLFKTTNGYWLIPTAEVPLTNLVADTIIDEAKLPIRMTAYTPCFRSEAGAAGKDTRGMIRQHQFSKVELVSITHPDKSKEEHERMTECAENLLRKLGLHFRTMVLCTGDIGFSAEKTYDIEVWMPGQSAFREISSCSNCGAFQSRRMKARFKSGKDNLPVHTLNGSGLPIGRTLVAIMENYQQADGSILVPDALKPYMGGLEKITA